MPQQEDGKKAPLGKYTTKKGSSPINSIFILRSVAAYEKGEWHSAPPLFNLQDLDFFRFPDYIFGQLIVAQAVVIKV